MLKLLSKKLNFLGDNYPSEDSKILNLKLNKILLNNSLCIKTCNSIESKIRFRNVVAMFQLAKLFSLTSLANCCLSVIKRCFTMVCGTENFLLLDYVPVASIFSSCELHITSELEVFESVDKWVEYKEIDRSKYAVKLL